MINNIINEMVKVVKNSEVARFELSESGKYHTFFYISYVDSEARYQIFINDFTSHYELSISEYLPTDDFTLGTYENICKTDFSTVDECIEYITELVRF